MTRLNSIRGACAYGRHVATKVLGTGDAGRPQGEEDTNAPPHQRSSPRRRAYPMTSVRSGVLEGSFI